MDNKNTTNPTYIDENGILLGRCMSDTEVMEYLISLNENKYSMDRNKKINYEFNEVYDFISEAHDKLNEFFMKHCSLGENDVDRPTLNQISDILYKMSQCKEEAHDVAEHFTWDK